MEKRDAIALMLMVFLAVFLFWKIGLGGSVTKNLNFDVSAEVKCIDLVVYKYCHFTRDVNVEVSEGRAFTIYSPPLALKTTPAKLSIGVTLTYPDGVSKMKHQEVKIYDSGWHDFNFRFPLTIAGNYQWNVEVCGSSYGFWRCVERSGSYMWGG